ncbi:DUF4365 domain-containing protein [Microbacterium sp.]|uniref:DUF4365 domain-containing protein n=1 Tax=Microbacterium sp. TaxID=51671 RepID=UPI003F70196A
MRQPIRDQLGEAGQSAVQLFFNDLGWGPLPTGKHDLGTDLFVQVRDADLTDLGMLLGVQVKTGDSWFREVTTQDGRPGWWFRESALGHESYWVNHHIPHILVMQDQSRTRQVWARLNRASVKRTAQGLRVFVPADQTVNAGVAPLWATIAAEAREGHSFEGARWSFEISDVDQDEWPRYALLASRIVAPHPNRGVGDRLDWPQAVALCVQANPMAWAEVAENRPEIPTVADARVSEDPGWRFAAAIHAWVSGSTSELEKLNESTLPKPLQVATAVCVAAILADRDDWPAATDVLRQVRRENESSADQAWVAVQLGWALFEQGRIDDARVQFEASLAMHGAFSSSLTNSAIRSAGILWLFDMAPAFTGDLASAAQASDTTLSWWNTQQVEDALNDYLRRAFKRWAHDASISIGASDSTHNNLFSADLASRLAGNRRASRYARYLRAMAGLSLPGAHAGPEDQLELLRRSGYPDQLKLALRHFRDVGPLSIVVRYMTEVTLRNATTTSLRADLKSLSIAGSYSSEDSARAWIDYLLGVLYESTEFTSRFNIESAIDWDVLDALSGLRLHMGEPHISQVLDYALSLDEDSTQLLERPLHRLLGTPETRGSAAVRDRTSEIVRRGMNVSPTSWIRTLLLNIAADHDGGAREDVSQRILRGDLTGLPSGFRIESMSSEEARSVVVACSERILAYTGETNRITVGELDSYLLLAQVAVFGPAEVAATAWEPLIAGIAEHDAIHNRKTDAIDFLAAHNAEIPRGCLPTLLAASKEISDAPASDLTLLFARHLQPVGPAFARLRLALSDATGAEWWDVEVARLLSGSSDERCAAVKVISDRGGHALLLLALTRDADSDVSGLAVSALATLSAKDERVAETTVPELLKLMENGGEDVALHIGGGLLGVKGAVDQVQSLIDGLRGHESLRIRSLTNVFDG